MKAYYVRGMKMVSSFEIFPRTEANKNEKNKTKETFHPGGNYGNCWSESFVSLIVVIRLVTLMSLRITFLNI